MPDQQLLNMTATAKRLGISVSKLSRMCKRGDCPPYFELGGKKLFDLHDVDDWKNARRVEPDDQPIEGV